MKSLCFINYDMTTRGGSQQVIINIANALISQNENYSITVLSLIDTNRGCAYELSPQVTYSTLLPYKARIREVLFKGRKSFRKFMQSHSFDVLFYVGAYAGFCGALLGKRYKIPKVFCDHGALMNQWNEFPFRTMRKYGSTYSDITITLTEQSRQAYIDKFGLSAFHVRCIYNWIDESVFDKACPYDLESNTLITAGRFSHEKGYDLLIEVATKMKQSSTNWTWEIYGTGDDFDKIKSLIEERELEEQVHLMGLTHDMYSCYGHHAAYVLTSYREGLPLVLLEAKANHLPLVSFDIVSGPSEILTDQKDGILIEPYDTDKMASELLALLHDRKKREEFSKNSSLNVSKFNKEKILPLWECLITELTEGLHL